ncbi:MAG: hypothetical protein K0R39_3396 [Symbiobacteriaceae bacterium]|jgi:uncharacterized phage protein gp47/JayE|nr:hypothetical protein [Symbiobacteriaceae bacterium]
MQPPGGLRPYEEIVTDMLQRLQQEGTLTDVNPGSVVRTLVEAFAREMAAAYAQLKLIYDMGFLETAEGASLDRLVAIVGQQRLNGLRAEGRAVFKRNPRVAGQVSIPAGTRVLVHVPDLSRQVIYATTEAGELQAGQAQVTVPVAAPVDSGADPAAFTFNQTEIAAARIELLQPIAGVAEVGMPWPTAARGYQESDVELRGRVQGLLEAAGGGTAKAIEQAVLSTGLVKGLVLRDALDTTGPPLKPGELEVIVDGDLTQPGVLEKVREAVAREKGPGILIRLQPMASKSLVVRLRVLPAAKDLSADRRTTLRKAVHDAVRQAVLELKAGDSLLWRPLMARILTVDGVLDLSDVTFTVDGVSKPVIVAGAQQPDPDVMAGALERIALPDQGPGVTVLFTEEKAVVVRFRVGGLTVAESGRPAAAFAMAKAFQEHLAALGGGIGTERTLSYNLARQAVLAAAPGPVAGSATFVLDVTYVPGGAEVSLTAAGETLTIAAGEVAQVHPEGPVLNWG